MMRSMYGAVGALLAGVIVSAGASAATTSAEIKLVGLDNGAWILKRPQEYDESWSALCLLDERRQSGWATPKGTTTPQQLLIALPELSVIRSVEFDSASVDGDEQGSRSARQVTVEVSDQGPSAGFQTIASPAHNQSLSEQRARALQAYLVAAGVAAARLKPQGLGASQPVASNETSLGRAQNRRVELVKN